MAGIINIVAVGENWTCPFCGRAQVIADQRHHAAWQSLIVGECEAGDLAVGFEGIVCANQECRKLSLNFALGRQDEETGEMTELIHEWRLLPASFAKPQPDCIPEPLRADYQEACAIRDLSPKASATLSRRCLQGMIRDFCGISMKRLVEEIAELHRRVTAGNAPAGVQADTLDAIDHVRSIGNIGAHMEADINVIVDVDPGEAQQLIGLIELLFEDWYVAREDRKNRLAAIGVTAATKAAARKAPPTATPTGVPAAKP